MKVIWRFSIVVLALLGSTAACATNERAGDDRPAEPGGPALIYFYTDN